MSSRIPHDKPKGLLENHTCKYGKNCCLRKHLVDYAYLNDLVSGYNRVTDIDGVLDIAGKILFLEFKLEGRQLSGVHQWLHIHLSEKEGQSSLIIWHDKDDNPVRCQWITKGEGKDKIELPNGKDDLERIIQTWMVI